MASVAHSAMERVKIASSVQSSNAVPHFLLIQVVKVVLQDDFVGFLLMAATVAAFCMVMPAALQDCSISVSYVSDTSSVVQSGNFLMHSVVAHIYRLPGSDGATRNSLSLSVYFVDCPAVIELNPFCKGISPAALVPQYWHRAEGFIPMFIAQAESRQRSKFVLEHFDTAANVPNIGVKIQTMLIKSRFG